MGDLISVIEKETSGTSFSSYRYCHDSIKTGIISYDDQSDIIWKQYGETEKTKHPIPLGEAAQRRMSYKSIFSYFLDGSRHTYKIDDMSYNKNVYPIIAGQVGIGCCFRSEDRKLSPALPIRIHMVLALPDAAFNSNIWEQNSITKRLLAEINKRVSTSRRPMLHFEDILVYNTNRDEAFDKKGIAKIQDYMVALEKKTVIELAKGDRLDESHYLIKDGSIEYQKMSGKDAINISETLIRNNYRRVIGVSKSFDPTKCFVQGGGTNSDIIAKLNLYERTPAYRYTSIRAGVDMCIWYIRIRDAKFTQSVFDGIIKVEKILCTDKEIEKGLDSDEINNISAYLINERNPVCYGADDRWANHLYPIYLTESFVKSKYISNVLFMQMF